MANLKKMELHTLVTHAQKGEVKALEKLIRNVQKDVYAIFSHLTTSREDISDLTQETLIKMAKALPQLKNPTKFKPWLNQIISNTFINYTKKLPQERIEVDEEQINEIRDKLNCEPGQKCLFAELDKIIKAALLTLPKELRLTLLLREYEGLSYQDISKITNSNLGTVKSRLSRARIKLQQELKDFI